MSTADPRLMSRFKFDQEDLAANRGGNLSTKQAQDIRKSDRSNNKLFAVLVLLALGGAAAVGRPLVLHPVSSQGDFLPRLVIVGILVFIALWLVRGIFTPLSTEVGSVQGKARLVRTTHRSGSVTDSESDRHDVVAYYLIVGGREFGINLADFDLFEEGATYAVYFSPDTQRILSLEPINDPT